MAAPWYPRGYTTTSGVPGPSASYKYMMDTPPSNSREMRNRAEKMRRDKLNSFIGELATLVPMVARSAKRMDKTSILRLTATHLRLYQTILSTKSRPQVESPKQIDQYLLEQIVCEQLGGFLLITTTNGKIIFVSPTVENLLGYLQTDLMGQSLYNVTSQGDHDKLKVYLTADGVLAKGWNRYFNMKMKRNGPRSENPVYEMVNVMGVHRHTNEPSDCNQNTSSSQEIVSPNNVNNNDILVLFVKLPRPESLSSILLEASKDEYITRHLIDGRIVNSDHRISIIAGYMTDEVSGLSAFKFMHRDDVRWVMVALRQMYDRGETRGSSCYRLLSRNGKFIYLQSFGFLEIDDHGIVESFICVNMLVDEDTGVLLNQEMKRRYAALANADLNIMSPGPSISPGVESVEDPKEVDVAVKELVKNLPSPGSESCSKPSSISENKDCSPSEPTEESSPRKVPAKIKPVLKRPPSTDANIPSKRQKPLSQRSPIVCMSPYQIPQITSIKALFTLPSYIRYGRIVGTEVRPELYKKNETFVYNACG